MNRAIKGGQVGVNGEFYEGGKFLPSTKNPKGTPKPRGTGKQEIAPYTWVVGEEGMTSIYKKLAGVFGKVIDGKMVINVSQQTLNYYRRTIEEVTILANRYNNGERWMSYAEWQGKVS